jgi:hypothetical protein
MRSDPGLVSLVQPLLAARSAVGEQVAALTARACQLAVDDPICRRLMTRQRSDRSLLWSSAQRSTTHHDFPVLGASPRTSG